MIENAELGMTSVTRTEIKLLQKDLRLLSKFRKMTSAKRTSELSAGHLLMGSIRLLYDTTTAGITVFLFLLK